MSKKPVFVIIGVFAAIIVATVWLTCFHRAKAMKSPCVENLQLIEWCKFRWMSDNHKTTNDTPTWDDLKAELYRHGWTNGIPVCPQGGTYTIGRVGEPPTCSIGGSEHSLPP
jgi:hypothetical protein